MDLKINADGKTAQLQRQSTEKKQVEVLGLTGDVVTKAKITYEVTDQQSMNGKTQAMPSPISGKTYLLEAAGDKITVTLDGGAAASPAEVEAVLDAEDRFGKPSKMEALIAGRTFKKGEAVDFPADQIADALGEKKGMKVTKLTLTYSGVDGSDPVFDMTMGFTQEQPDMSMTVQATGKVTADLATGELLAMSVEGPVEMSGKATATGTIKMNGTRGKRQ
jgi:hypothetical protein